MTITNVSNKVKHEIIEEGGSIVIPLTDHWEHGFSRIMNALFIDKVLTSNEVRLLGILLTFANYPGAQMRAKPVSLSYLRKLSGLGKNTVIRAVDSLIKLGHIKEAISPRPDQCRCIVVISPYLYRENYENKQNYSDNSQNITDINEQDLVAKKDQYSAQTAQGVYPKRVQGVYPKVNPKELNIKKTKYLCAQRDVVLEKYKLSKSAHRREITEFNKLLKMGKYSEDQILKAVESLFEHGTLKDGSKCDRPMSYLASGPNIAQKVLDRANKKDRPEDYTFDSRKISEAIRAASSGEKRFNDSFNSLNSYEKKFIGDRNNARKLGGSLETRVNELIKNFVFANKIKLE